MADITLTSSMRSNLLSLQNTQSLMDRTQNRLSTGLKVNSALDDSGAFFTASNLNNRAADLNGLLDTMGQAVQTIKSADEGITAITNLVQQAKSLANTAMDDKSSSYVSKGTLETGYTAAAFNLTVDGKNVAVGVPGGNTLADIVTAMNAAFDVHTAANNGKAGDLVASVDGTSIKIEAKDGKSHSISGATGGLDFSGTANNSIIASSQKNFNEILSQIDQLASDASYKGVNLLRSDDLKVIFNEDRSSSINIEGVDASTTGLGLAAANFATAAGVQTAIDQADAAISNLRTMSTEFSSAYSIVQNREEFTTNLVNVLTEGADKLTLADMNEESANMLALQTRQQLAVNALSLSSQAQQSVLKLF